MDEVIEVTLRITAILKSLEVPYLIGGSFASTIHGISRSTQDVDVVADLQSQHVTPLVAALEGEFYFDESAIREAVARRSTFNVVHLDTYLKADIFVADGKPSTRSEMERRQPYTFESHPTEEILIASPEDIVIQKLYWYRLGDQVSERQWSDVMNVLLVRGKHLDVGYMRELADEMGVADLLDRVLHDAGLQS